MMLTLRNAQQLHIFRALAHGPKSDACYNRATLSQCIQTSMVFLSFCGQVNAVWVSPTDANLPRDYCIRICDILFTMYIVTDAVLMQLRSVADDKKLTTTLKRIGVTNIPAIEEVNMFKNDGEVIHFVGPKGERVMAKRDA